MKIVLYLYLILFVFTNCECERDPIDAGVVSTVSGNAYDFRNDIPAQGIKIKVGEFKRHFVIDGNGNTFIKWVDSTYTDINGDYNLTFATSGLGDNYKLFAEETIDIRGYNDVIDITNIGGSNVFDLNFVHIYPIKLIITVNNVSYSPIQISNYYNHHIDKITQANGQFERILYLDKNFDNENKVKFSIDTDPNNYYSDYSDIKAYEVIIPAASVNATTIVDFPITINDSDFN